MREKEGSLLKGVEASDKVAVDAGCTISFWKPTDETGMNSPHICEDVHISGILVLCNHFNIPEMGTQPQALLRIGCSRMIRSKYFSLS